MPLGSSRFLISSTSFSGNSASSLASSFCLSCLVGWTISTVVDHSPAPCYACLFRTDRNIIGAYSMLKSDLALQIPAQEACKLVFSRVSVCQKNLSHTGQVQASAPSLCINWCFLRVPIRVGFATLTARAHAAAGRRAAPPNHSESRVIYRAGLCDVDNPQPHVPSYRE